MLTKKLSTYAIVLFIIMSLLMAFSPRKDFQIIGSEENDSLEEEISLCLPIDKNDNFLLESGYGERLHPILGVMRLHTGIDLVAQEGVPVVSTQEGVVIKAQLEGDWGNLIVVQHANTYSTAYSHLKSREVKDGDKVQKGQKIGLVGSTGMSNKPHLHFELRKNGTPIDPITYLPEVK